MKVMSCTINYCHWQNVSTCSECDRCGVKWGQCVERASQVAAVWLPCRNVQSSEDHGVPEGGVKVGEKTVFNAEYIFLRILVVI